MTGPMLRVENLSAGYGAREVVHGIALTVQAGRSLCLVGPNGAGKSTVLNAIGGLADVRSGRVLVNGRDITRLRPADRLRGAGVAYVLQGSSVFPDMTVAQNLEVGGYLLGRAARSRAAAARVLSSHETLAARRDQPAQVLSGGERRILEITRALVMNPSLLLLDEPSIGLEPRAIAMVFALLRARQRESGITIVMVEQNARKGLEFADNGIVLTDGRIALAGPAAELLADPLLGRLFLGAAAERQRSEQA